MKKYLCTVLAAIMIFTLFPLNGFAAENTPSEYDEVIALACEVFPEYASAIRGECINTNSRTRSSTNDEVVFHETRSISDTESISLSQLASGNVIVIKNTTDYMSIETTSSTTDILNVGVAGTASFTVIMSFWPNEFFKLSNVSFNIYYYSDSYFTNTGTATTSSRVSIGKETITNTLIDYPLTYVQPPYFADFRLYFSNNQLIAQMVL